MIFRAVICQAFRGGKPYLHARNSVAQREEGARRREKFCRKSVNNRSQHILIVDGKNNTTHNKFTGQGKSPTTLQVIRRRMFCAVS